MESMDSKFPKERVVEAIKAVAKTQEEEEILQKYWESLKGQDSSIAEREVQELTGTLSALEERCRALDDQMKLYNSKQRQRELDNLRSRIVRAKAAKDSKRDEIRFIKLTMLEHGLIQRVKGLETMSSTYLGSANPIIEIGQRLQVVVAAEGEENKSPTEEQIEKRFG